MGVDNLPAPVFGPVFGPAERGDGKPFAARHGAAAQWGRTAPDGAGHHRAAKGEFAMTAVPARGRGYHRPPYARRAAAARP